MKDVIIKTFDDGYVICLLNDQIYIFDDSGHFLYKSDTIHNDKIVNYYSLNVGNVGSTYKYYIGILTEESLNLYYYEYNKETNEIIIIAKTEDIKILNSNEPNTAYYTIENSGLNCHLINDINKGEALACFMILSYYITYYWHIGFYSIDGDTIINNDNYSPIIVEMNNKVKFFKVDVNYDKTVSLICGIEAQDNDFCFHYLTSQSELDLKCYIYNEEPSCQSEYYYKLKVDYFSLSDQFVFSCLGNEHNIKYIAFHVDNEDNLFKNDCVIAEETECWYLNGYNLYPELKIDTNEYRYFLIYDYLCDLESNHTEENNSEKNNSEEKESEKENINIRHIEEDVSEENEYKCLLEKCSKCDRESETHNLCIKCDINKGYYPLKSHPYQEEQSILNDSYIDCFNFSTKPSNFFFNDLDGYFEPCFETCETCYYGGNELNNNCVTCGVWYICNPGVKYACNCVAFCNNYFYFTK